MAGVVDPVDDRVAHIEVAGREVDLGAQRHAAVFKFAGFHPPEQLQVFRNRAVAVRAGGRVRQVAAVFVHLVGRQLAHIGQPFADQLHGKFIHLREVGRRVEKPVVPGEAQPFDVFLDGVHVLHVLFGRVGVVHPQVAQAAEPLRRAEVDVDRFQVADVQVAVRLRRKTRVDALTGKPPAGRDVFFDEFVDKIAFFLGFRPNFVFHICDPLSKRHFIIFSAGRWRAGCGAGFRPGPESPESRPRRLA